MTELIKLSDTLKKLGYEVSVFENTDECAKYLDGSIDGQTVGIGGSVTVKQLGLFDMLKTHNDVFWHNDAEQVKKYGGAELKRCAMNSDVYISSVNAISESGITVNIDMSGNRLASTVFGHKKLYLIVGKNKIATDLEGAVFRARNVAAPLNAKRLGMKTPCAIKGDRCYDCNSPDRICRGFLICERAMTGQKTEIVLVNQELGF